MKKLRIYICLFLITIFYAVNTVPAQADDNDLKAALSVQRAFINVAKNLKPSVVNISMEKSSGHSASIQNFQMDDDTAEFFRRFFGGTPFGNGRQQQEEPKIQGTGSGVIISKDGTIVTNNHVVSGATKLTVKLYNGNKYDAKIIGQDPQTDVAVIKISAKETLIPAQFADSDKVEVGEWAVALGSPMGLEQTVTTGIVSAVGRSGLGAAQIENFIQTDASINPGNSGGPLVDLNCKVIGINTLIFNAPGSGLGFAIPSNIVKTVANQISTKGEVERPYLGITMQNVSENLANHYNLKNQDGAVILEIQKDSPAAKSGLKPMDIITEFNGKTIKETTDLQKYVLQCEVGKSVIVKVLRNGKPKAISLKLEQMPQTFGLSKSEIAELPAKKLPQQSKLTGLTVKTMTSEIAAKMRIDYKEGVIISSIDKGSIADKAGLLVGDVITQINDEEITNEDDFHKQIKEIQKKDSCVFLVYRSGTPMFIIVALEK